MSKRGQGGGASRTSRPRSRPRSSAAPATWPAAHARRRPAPPTSSSRTRPTTRSRCRYGKDCRRRAWSPRAPTCSRCASASSRDEHDVPIVENPPLARALYRQVEVGQEIPADYFGGRRRGAGLRLPHLAPRAELGLSGPWRSTAPAPGRHRTAPEALRPPDRARGRDGRRDDGAAAARRSLLDILIAVNIAAAR